MAFLLDLEFSHLFYDCSDGKLLQRFAKKSLLPESEDEHDPWSNQRG